MSLLAVAIGGFTGAILRYAIGMVMPVVGGFPFGTLLINLSGCLFLSWFFTITTNRVSIDPGLKLAIGTGFTGAFTTFSTFSVETLTLIEQDRFFLALTYVFLSVGGGIALSLLGARLAAVKRMKGEA